MSEYEVKIYKIWYADSPNEIYVGSTKRNLAQRMGDHRRHAKSGIPYKVYTIMREKGINNFEYVMLDSKLVRNRDEQMAFEQKYLDKLKPTLNSCRAVKNGDTRMLYFRERRKNKYYCNCCDISVVGGTGSAHNKGKKHIFNFIHS